ncbi:MAG TPA: RDD family protein [candidate division WWE3 bacterium]|uniref:RDD family protein n=1 Tax=candidate division WWE3 bacterium TaxID=2053526 RepID=A0A7C1NMV3_UNCKA|nr:RDD family protein [candidate division WWE3 bacterium]
MNDEKCKNCEKTLVPGTYFCSHCDSFAENPKLGKKAGLFKRWLANNLDPFIYLFTLSIAMWISWSKGNTPAHSLLGMKIVKKDGTKPGFGTMLLRELVGKTASILFFGIGYYWAVFDADRRAWHDRIAGTIVVEK